jgi:hypothetical protein
MLRVEALQFILYCFQIFTRYDLPFYVTPCKSRNLEVVAFLMSRMLAPTEPLKAVAVVCTHGCVLAIQFAMEQTTPLPSHETDMRATRLSRG